MKFGIVGGGFGYDCHFEALKNIESVEIVGITDSGSGKLLNKLSNPEIYSNSIDHLLALKPNVMTIATPPKNQFSLISKIAQKNIHILCEKPLCISSKQGLDSNLLVEKLKLGNCVNFQYRFEPGIQYLKSKINDQAVANISSIEVLWLTSGRKDPNSLWTWRNDKNQGGGVKNAFLIHIIDLIQWLLMKEIDHVIKSKNEIVIPLRPDKKSRKTPVTAEDLVNVNFIVKDNIKVSCKVGNCNEESIGMRIVINGENGKLIYEHKPPFRACDQSVFIDDHNKKDLLFNAANSIPKIFTDTRTYSLRELYMRFIKSIEENDKKIELPSFKTAFQIKEIIDKII